MKLATIKEVSEFLNVKKTTLYSWVHSGSIPFYKLNGLVRFNMDEITEWVKSSRPIPPKVNISLKRTDNLDVDSIVKRAVESVRGKSYNPSKRETSLSQGLGKEDQDGTL